MLDALYDLTEGNPFFLEEVLKALMMAGELVEGEDGWHWKRADTWHIPLSLQDAVELRLTRLSADARRVLQLAAVAGRRFDFALLLADHPVRRSSSAGGDEGGDRRPAGQ